MIKFDLNFPEPDQEPLPPSIRSVDEINEWIEEDYERWSDRTVYEKDKKRNSVNVLFSLKLRRP